MDRRRLWLWAGAITGLLTISCSAPPPALPPSTAVPGKHTAPLTSPAAAATPVVTGGCGASPTLRGGVPEWLLAAAGGGAGLQGLPYVVAEPAVAGGFLFGYPLKAGHPENPANKILWAVRTPRNGAPLVVELHPLGAPAPRVDAFLPADSFPGQIYPSIMDVPTPGCWDLSLSWSTGRARVQLEYLATS